jgi:hypothetical protein
VPIVAQVKMSKFSAKDFERDTRQQEWRHRSAEKLRAIRRARLDRLRAEEPAVRRALSEYEVCDEGNVPMIAFRQDFVRLRQARDVQGLSTDNDAEIQPGGVASHRRARELASRPPLTRLVNRRSNALALLMTAVYVAHLEVGPGAMFGSDRRNATKVGNLVPWSALAGMNAPRDGRARRVRVTRAIDELVVAKLASLGPVGSRDRYDRWQLLSDSGSEQPYKVPGETAPKCVRLPASFFLRGWHLVLEPTEVAVLLAVMDMTGRIDFRGRRQSDGVGVALPRSVRRDLYGISGETYTHVHELAEFGLLELYDTMPHRHAGKIRPKAAIAQASDSAGGVGDESKSADDDSAAPEPYRFVIKDTSVFDRDAATVVKDSLSTFPLPYRLWDFAGLIEPTAAVQQVAAARRSTGQ